MFKSCILFLNVCAIIQVLRVESHTTHRDKYLAGPVIERLNIKDWMQCLVACTASNDCVSYNFESRSGTCELLSEGLDLRRNCHGRKFLAPSQGWLFHQITDTFWSSWSQWTNCTLYGYYGRGNQTRKRACISSSNGYCRGKKTETRTIYLDNCNVAFWSSWNEWSSCTCIDGVQKQTRKLTYTCNAFSNGNCSGEKSETKICPDPSTEGSGQGSN